MADTIYTVEEIRFTFEPGLTHAYVLCSAPSDGMLGVQGWHHCAYPSDDNAQRILTEDIAAGKYLTEWAQKAP